MVCYAVLVAGAAIRTFSPELSLMNLAFLDRSENMRVNQASHSSGAKSYLRRQDGRASIHHKRQRYP